MKKENVMSKEIGRVKCRVCDNEKAGFCKVKGCSVKLNKSRVCEAFIMNEAKIKVSIKPKTTVRPDWYWNRKKLIRQMKEEMKKQQEMPATTPYVQQTGELGKPDILSKFRSTATEAEK